MGLQAGESYQSIYAVAVGHLAGQTSQANSATAVGYQAGQTSQGSNAVAMGLQAGESYQGTSAVAVGVNAGAYNQGVQGITVGREAGYLNQGANAIALGAYAGRFNQHNNTIVLCATGAGKNTGQASSFYVEPVRGGNFAASALAYTNGGEIVEETGMNFDASGNVGIGTASPDTILQLEESSTPTLRFVDKRGVITLSDSLGKIQFYSRDGSLPGDYAPLVELDVRTINSTVAPDGALFFRMGTDGNLADNGYISYGSANLQINFTGQHRTFIKDIPYTRAEELEGLIVSADNNKYVKMSGGIEVGSNAITTNESLPVVSLSTKVNDKKCFGVISASEDPETREDAFGNFVSISQKELGDTRVYINSVGEGAMWVTNINGPLESGDYITTSNVPGYGQRQESEFLANYTVAKITMDCDFAPATQPIQIIKKELANVNYWVKTTVSNVTLEEYSNLAEENRTTELETYYTKDVEQTYTYKPTVEVTAEDSWDDVLVRPSDVTYAEWSNLEANVQNTYTLTYTQNDFETVRYEKTTVSNVSAEDEWDAVHIEPSTVTYAEWSNLEANVQNTFTLTYTTTTTVVATEEEYNHLAGEEQVLYEPVYTKTTTEEVGADTEGADAHTRTLYKKIESKETKTETEGYDIDVREELVNVLDEHGQLQWEDHPTETEKAYKIRYLTADGTQTDEANAVHIAAFVGCTYHCG